MILSSRRSKAIPAPAADAGGLADLASATEPDTHDRSGNIGSLSLKLSLLAASMRLIMAHPQTSGKQPGGQAVR
jgi:hypothetical protein